MIKVSKIRTFFRLLNRNHKIRFCHSDGGGVGIVSIQKALVKGINCFAVIPSKLLHFKKMQL